MTLAGSKKIINLSLDGSFGDKRVLLTCCLPKAPNGVNVVLLHGVHSSANLGQHNKFRSLAKHLLSLGYTAWLVETSRHVRNRQQFGDNVAEWVNTAFSGKTFPQEQQDVFIAIKDVLRRISGALLWVWGFSLGGIIALSAAAQLASPHENGRPAIGGLVLSGTGLVAYAEIESLMRDTPILSTLRQVLAPDLLSQVRTEGLIAFRGENDEVFSRESCLDLVRGVPLSDERKHFFPIEGADHSLRTRCGRHDPAIMSEMAELVHRTWGLQ